jgi:hypothetical protein
LGPHEERVSGIGEAAVYFDNTSTRRQGIFFRAKGKYVILYVNASGPGEFPKAAVVSLATLVISKPIDTLKAPPS